MDKIKWIEAAEVFDSWRVVPRLFLGAVFAWCVWLTQFLLQYYMHLPKDERGLETSGFASVVFLGVFGFLKLVFDTYTQNGRSWDTPMMLPTPTQTTEIRTVTPITAPAQAQTASLVTPPAAQQPQ